MEKEVIALLHDCRHCKDLHQAKRLYTYMREHRLDTTTLLGNYLVPTLVDCGCLPDAQRVFDRLPHKNQHSWTYLISGYIDCGERQHALLLCRNMLHDCGRLNSFTYVALLKACTRLKDLEDGRTAHCNIVKHGLDRNLFTGNTLVDLYGKCGSLEDAHQVLKKLPVRDAVSWNALISGHVEHGLCKQALTYFEQMQLQGVSPTNITFVCSLKACSIIGDASKGELVCMEIVKKGLETDLSVGNAMVDMYVKSGLTKEACLVFDELPVCDAASWNALLAGYAEHGRGAEILSCFNEMQKKGIYLADVTFVYTLKGCTILVDSESGHASYIEIVKRGMETNLFVGSACVGMYAKCGLLEEAQDAFDQLPIRSTVLWNALIAGYVEFGHGDKALRAFEMMQLDQVALDDTTAVSSLKACGILRERNMGQKLHAEIVKRGLETELQVGNTLVDMYVKCGFLAEAQGSFNQLADGNVIALTALVAGYAESGLGADLFNCLKQMQLSDISPDANMLFVALKACGAARSLELGQEVHVEIVKRGVERELYVSHALVDMYAKCALLEEAQKLFDKLTARSIISWNTLIAGYAEHGFGEQALSCFKKMEREKVCPVSITFACNLKACGITGALETGQETHCEIAKRGLERNLFVGNTILDMYGKCGSLVEAQQVFDKFHVQDVVSWNALIKGYGENHEGNMALRCFEEMREKGVKPDTVTFTCLLSACSLASLVQKGREYFKMMGHYEIKPTLDHFTCMVDLLARSGLVHEAEKFVEAMQCPPSKEILKALLSASKVHGKIELGLRCFQQLIQMNEVDAAAYMLLQDLYTSIGMWRDANRTEEMRKHVGAQKTPASVSMEVNKEVFEFVVGVNPSEVVAAGLEALNPRMKDDGYVPNVDVILRHTALAEKEATFVALVANDFCSLTHHNDTTYGKVLGYCNEIYN